MTDRNPEMAQDIVRRIEQIADFVESDAIRDAVERHVPVTMPRAPGALGLDVQLWVGLGLVGVWASLDAFAERAGLGGRCVTCGRKCLVRRFQGRIPAGSESLIAECEDLRHLYAHNYAGIADAEYFSTPGGDPRARHVLVQGSTATLASGGTFDGRRVQLDLQHLRAYAQAARAVLGTFT